MSMEMEEVVRCDKCGRSPNGDSPDNVAILACGHDICNECLHPRNVGPLKNLSMGELWCRICEKATKQGRAPNEEGDDEKLVLEVMNSLPEKVKHALNVHSSAILCRGTAVTLHTVVEALGEAWLVIVRAVAERAEARR